MNLLNIIEYFRIRKIQEKYYRESVFDMAPLDNIISDYADKIYYSNRKQFKEFKCFSTDVGFWGTKLHDLGGHTPCLVNLAESLYEKDKFPLFLTRLKQTYQDGPKAMNKLANCCDSFGIDFHSYKIEHSLIKLYNLIVEHAPKVIFLYIQQNDILATAIIHLLKKHTNIKFAFFNHASHFPNLGMTFADIILEGMPHNVEDTKKKRHLNNTVIVGLQSKRKDNIKYYSKDELDNMRQKLGIKEGELLTVSGGSSYKYFSDGKSEHCEMIKRILEKTPNLKHLAITNLDSEQEKIVDDIFEDSPDVRKRLIFHPLTPQFDILFQCADLFIDSFPISSAMTQIDLMSMKIPTTVKINRLNQIYSFHEYMPEDYPYMYESVEDMEKGILYLLSDKDERERITQSNYNFWLNHYESECVKKKYQAIIGELIDGK